MTEISCTIVTLQKSRCEHDIKNSSNLSILIMNKCQMILFCIETVWVLLRSLIKPDEPTLISGMCRILRSNSRQLFMLSHWANCSLLPLSKTFFICSTTARVARASVKHSLYSNKAVVKSDTVWRPISVRIITLVENKHSTGIVKFTNIRTIMSINLAVRTGDWIKINVSLKIKPILKKCHLRSLTLMRNGIKSFCTYWPKPSVRRNVRNVWSSQVFVNTQVL